MTRSILTLVIASAACATTRIEADTPPKRTQLVGIGTATGIKTPKLAQDTAKRRATAQLMQQVEIYVASLGHAYEVATEQSPYPGESLPRPKGADCVFPKPLPTHRALREATYTERDTAAGLEVTASVDIARVVSAFDEATEGELALTDAARVWYADNAKAVLDSLTQTLRAEDR